MAQPFLTADVVIAKINAAPGKTLSHADLVSALQTEGYRNIGQALLGFKREGLFLGKTAYDGVNKPVLMYSLAP